MVTSQAQSSPGMGMHEMHNQHVSSPPEMKQGTTLFPYLSQAPAATTMLQNQHTYLGSSIISAPTVVTVSASPTISISITAVVSWGCFPPIPSVPVVKAVTLTLTTRVSPATRTGTNNFTKG